MMRRNVALCGALLLVSACTAMVMVQQSAVPEVKPDAGKVTLVLFRCKSMGGMVTVTNYVDGKFLGQTKGKSYYVATVEPGAHHLVAIGDSKNVCKVTLEAGKVYYVRQDTPMGQPIFIGSEPGEFEKEKGEMDYLVRDAAQPEPVLEPETQQKLVARYEEDVQKDPNRFKDMLELKGF
jgi:hypothetical protein